MNLSGMSDINLGRQTRYGHHFGQHHPPDAKLANPIGAEDFTPAELLSANARFAP